MKWGVLLLARCAHSSKTCLLAGFVATRCEGVFCLAPVAFVPLHSWYVVDVRRREQSALTARRPERSLPRRFAVGAQVPPAAFASGGLAACLASLPLRLGSARVPARSTAVRPTISPCSVGHPLCTRGKPDVAGRRLDSMTLSHAWGLGLCCLELVPTGMLYSPPPCPG